MMCCTKMRSAHVHYYIYIQTGSCICFRRADGLNASALRQPTDGYLKAYVRSSHEICSALADGQLAHHLAHRRETNIQSRRELLYNAEVRAWKLYTARRREAERSWLFITRVFCPLVLAILTKEAHALTRFAAHVRMWCLACGGSHGRFELARVH